MCLQAVEPQGQEAWMAKVQDHQYDELLHAQQIMHSSTWAYLHHLGLDLTKASAGWASVMEAANPEEYSERCNEVARLIRSAFR